MAPPDTTKCECGAPIYAHANPDVDARCAAFFATDEDYFDSQPAGPIDY